MSQPDNSNGANSRTPLTLGQVIHSLTTSQAWAIGSALVAIVAGSYAFGVLFQPAMEHWLARPRTCANMVNYPLGLWMTQGVIVHVGRKDTTFNDELGLFTTRTGGVWYAGEGGQLADGTYRHRSRKLFTTNAAPAPGRMIRVTWTNQEDNDFVGMSDLLVSDDGCSMEGSFTSTGSSLEAGGVEGFVQYCWKNAPQCPALREGWRPPRVVVAP